MSRWVIRPKSSNLLQQLTASTPARLAVGRVGVRPPTSTWLKFRQDHAMARDAVKSEFSDAFLSAMQEKGFPVIHSLAADKQDFILFPPKGKATDAATLAHIKDSCPGSKQVQIVISDGLSARASEAHSQPLLTVLLQGFDDAGISYGTPIVARRARVRIADQIAHCLGMNLVINLIGERPGLSAADSMSAYMTYNPRPETLSAERTVISNIHGQGIAPEEAARQMVTLVKKMLAFKTSGVELQQL